MKKDTVICFVSFHRIGPSVIGLSGVWSEWNWPKWNRSKWSRY